MRLRHQLAVYSPVTIASIAAAVAQALRLQRDPRPDLARLLEREYGADRMLLCGSGTQALQIAIATARSIAGERAPVALPAYSCYDVASAAIGAEARVVLYDIDAETLTPDTSSLRAAFEAGARVAVVAPLYGVPVEWEQLEALAHPFGATLIEDAAQGHGAVDGARRVGSLGALTVLSFGRGKGWTGGGGGALLARGPNALRLPALPEPSGRSDIVVAVGLLAQWLLGRPSLYGLPRLIPGLRLGETTYRSPVEPHAMSRATAAALLASRDVAAGEAAARRERATRVLDDRARRRLVPVALGAGRQSGFLRLPMLRGPGAGTQRLDASLVRAGVEAGYPTTLADLPALRPQLESVGSYPGADRLVRELVTAPTHSLSTEQELRRIIDEIGGGPT